MADGAMISRGVKSVPKDDTDFRLWVEKALRQHYQDIKTLFDTCTDIDRFEKLQRDNKQV
mgnify:CR=1 FL=1